MVGPATTKLSSRGQVVIPEEIRTRLGLEAGVRFVVAGDGDIVVLKALRPPRPEEFTERLDRVQEAARQVGVTARDVERALRALRAQKDVTERLNEVYADEPYGVHLSLRRAQARSAVSGKR